MSRKSLLRALGVALVSILCLSACSPEEYGACTIPNTTAHKAACLPAAFDAGQSGEADETQGVSTATCTADYVFDCDSMICGIFESSDAFCTRRCIREDCDCVDKTDPSCPCGCPAGKSCVEQCPEDAACVEWVAGSGDFYCLPEEKGCKKGHNYSSDSICSNAAAE